MCSSDKREIKDGVPGAVLGTIHSCSIDSEGSVACTELCLELPVLDLTRSTGALDSLISCHYHRLQQIMSFLAGSGAECGPSNPLSQLLKQQNYDHSLHQTNYSSQPGPSNSLRSHVGGPNGGQHEDAERFFQQGGAGGRSSTPQFANMEGMRRKLENVSRGGSAGPLKGDREWASQYNPAGSQMTPADMARMEEQFRQQQQHPGDLTGDFWRHQQQQQQQSAAGASFSSPEQVNGSSAYQRPGFAPSYGAYGGGMGMRGGMMGGSSSMMYQQQPLASTSTAMDKGKGRFVELDDADWEAQFARAGESVVAEDKVVDTPAEATTRPLDPDTVNLLEGDIDIDASEADAELLQNLQSTWDNLQSTLKDTSSMSDAEMAAWEAQFGSQFVNGDSGLDETSMGMGIHRTWTKDNVDEFLKDESAFPYTSENPYLEMKDPFAEGQRLLAEGAPLSEAALAFEAACRIDEGRGEAWKAAGETWAADEREVKGIRALEKAVGCGGADGVGAWMSLAVAYVNEGQEARALATLERWLSLAYPTVALPAPDPTATVSPWDQSNRIIDLFLGAARAGPMSRVKGQSDELTEVDPDVQVGLGVLFYSNSDYERAKDCFEAALSVRPNDFLLWNRLGATLANGGLPEDAIQAYRRALDLRPTFTRAIYNLGVSCLNIGCYHEAAEHLLAAIEGQATRPGPGLGGDGSGAEEDGSSNLWHTLRRAFLCMERHDLAEKAQPGTSLNEFRGAGFEF